MHIIVGTYEELILGYRLKKDGDVYKFEQTFTDHSHIGYIRTAGISRKDILATGSTDETIRIFNLKKNVVLGTLMHHSGTITQITFFQDNHMFSTSEDGSMCVWKNYTWECLRQFRGHKGPVNSVAVHPSGKIAITVSKDKTLRTWNLITGRHAYISNIKEVADWVMWSPDGEHYAVSIYNKINIYKLEDADIHCTIKADKRINNITFINNSIIAFGCEGGKITLFDFVNDKEVTSIKLKCTRIKGLACNEKENEVSMLVAASSDGNIWVFEVDNETKSLKELASHDTKFRITCLAVTPPGKSKTAKEESLVLGKLEVTDEERDSAEKDSDDSETEEKKTKKKARTETKSKKKTQKRKSNPEIDNTQIQKTSPVKKPKKKKRGSVS